MSNIPRSATIANRLRALGFSFIPCEVRTKRPLVKTWLPYQERHPTDAEIAAWCRRPVNFGIVCGAVSNLVAVDCDDAEAIEFAERHLPKTPMRTNSGGGGVHLFYRHPGGSVRSPVRVQPAGCAQKLKIDLRADGAYILGPGSIHPSGRVYRAPTPWPKTLDAIPIYNRDWLREADPPEPPPRVVRPTSASVETRARAYLRSIPPPQIRSGSDAAVLYAAARLVLGFDLDPTVAEGLIWEWAGGRPGWSRGWIAAKVRNAVRYGTETVGGLL